MFLNTSFGEYVCTSLLGLYLGIEDWTAGSQATSYFSFSTQCRTGFWSVVQSSLILAILVGVKWDHIAVSLCISGKINNWESFCMFIGFFEKCLLKYSAYLQLDFLPFSYWFVSVLYIFLLQVLFWLYVAITFFHSAACLFTSDFFWQTILNFNVVQWLVFSFIVSSTCI